MLQYGHDSQGLLPRLEMLLILCFGQYEETPNGVDRRREWDKGMIIKEKLIVLGA